MRLGVTSRRSVASLILIGLACFFNAGSVCAEVVSLAQQSAFDDTFSLLSPKSFASRSLRDAPARDYQGLPIAGWMLTPSFLIGGVYDDNLFQFQSHRTGAPGLHLQPTLIAERKTGIHKTLVYLDGDFRIFPSQSGGDAINGKIGFTHVWEARRDLTIKTGAEYSRHTDPYNNGFVVSPTGEVLGVLTAPLRYNLFVGNVSGVESFDRLFVGLSATAIGAIYDSLSTTLGSSSDSGRNNVTTAILGRMGYALTPLLYAYVEPTGNFRNSSDNAFNSQGYRVVGGLGSDRISLFRGEVYAGFQKQFYDNPLFPTQSSPVFGGRVFWYPTRAWTVGVSLDETYQEAAVALVGNNLGSAARVVTAAVRVNYALSRSWSACVNSGYSDVAYISGGRRDMRWTMGSTLDYQIYRNLSATAEYSLVNVASNAAFGSFTRNVFTLGATYKY